MESLTLGEAETPEPVRAKQVLASQRLEPNGSQVAQAELGSIEQRVLEKMQGELPGPGKV